MLYGTDRNQLRGVFFNAWERYRQGDALEGAEQTIVAVALAHPEYHTLLDDPDRNRDRDYSPELGESNPFLHMAMHIAVQEQLDTDSPTGIRSRYHRLLRSAGDEHDVQHRIMECLGETIWQSQRTGTPPSEPDYLDCLDRLIEIP
jgi:hypothetical protein